MNNLSENCAASAGFSGLFVPSQIVSGVLSSVCHHGGKVSEFLFDRKRENCTLTVHDCDCTDVVSANYSSVTFSGCEPVFTVVLPVEKASFFPGKEPYLKNDSSIDFDMSLCVQTSVLYSVLHLLSEFAESLALTENALFIKSSGERCEVNVLFSQVRNPPPDDESILCTVAKYAYLFRRRSSLQKRQKTSFFPLVTVVAEKTENESMTNPGA